MNVLTILKHKGRDVETIAANCLVGDAAKTLNEKRIGTLVICGLSNTIDGIISERDIVRAVALHGPGALKGPVSDYMTSPVETCEEQDTVEILMTRMTGRRFRHLPVVKDGRLAGIVSIGDVVMQRIAEAEMMAQAMKDYIATG
ncbi:MAG: inosine-5-monophosphate dehydrogenase [Hyphomicrobiales bacterium]|nr:MAG: inosine-5-monophosphate dehydrogenase [Hyphomicrobiales bacterium]